MVCLLSSGSSWSDRHCLRGQTDTGRALLEEGATKLLMCSFFTVIEYLLCVPGAMLGTSNEHHKLSVELRESDGEVRQQSNDLIK